MNKETNLFELVPVRQVFLATKGIKVFQVTIRCRWQGIRKYHSNLRNPINFGRSFSYNNTSRHCTKMKRFACFLVGLLCTVLQAKGESTAFVQ
jgi:hypothetical protein